MQIRYDRCPNCMKGLQSQDDICQYCGFDIAHYEERPTCLRPFTVLQNKYMIGRVIGVGGFGITYIGWDLNLQTYIAIKEYFPESLAARDTSGDATHTTVMPNTSQVEVYNKGLKRYVEEAQNLSKFYNLPGIVSVKDFFYENGTGYIVMEYINGTNLKEYLNSQGGRLDEATVLALMKPVLESLYTIHNAGLVHRDISPDNIMVTTEGKIKLIDFGSARGQSTSETDKTYTVILKHGYAPSEQYYAKGNQGPWTDIYSLCASMYKMLTGQIPPNSIERMEDDQYVAPSAYGAIVSPRTEAVLAKGLAVKVNDRYQNIGELLSDLFGAAPIQNANPMPMVNTAMKANPSSVSQHSMGMQSMYLQESAQTEKPKQKKNVLPYIVIAVLVVALFALIGIFAGKSSKKDDEKTTDTETETTTEKDDKTTEEKPEPDTEIEIPQVDLTGYQYQWPTEMSSDWRDYMINLGGTIYQLPIPYGEWVSQGWKSNDLPTHIAAGDYDWVDFYNDDIEMTTFIANFGFVEAPVEECFIVAVSIDTEYDKYVDGYIVELAGGVRLKQSSVNDVKTAFGAPDYAYNNDEDGSSSLDYAGDTYEDGCDFEFQNDVMTSVSIANTKAPEGLEVDASQIDMNPPAINASYIAPDGPSTDRFDSIFTVDGVSYKLPCPVSEFTANGWVLDTATDDCIYGSSSCYTSIQKNGSKITVTIENSTVNAILPVNGMITAMSFDKDYFTLEASFPGGLAIGSPGADIEALYSDMGEDYERDDSYSSFIAYDVYNWDAPDGNDYIISIYSNPNTDIIEEYSYTIY